MRPRGGEVETQNGCISWNKVYSLLAERLTCHCCYREAVEFSITCVLNFIVHKFTDNCVEIAQVIHAWYRF
ncbi:hypothetical protein CMEL01_01918 [Colletotrichum melonis]|uniref:Uncharacterized protein n=1 Tax=Colletotrichum melonis TaxID=1209925 RepID=A0AAI9XSU1_9PEZI|nr:hypothetical protein CMEL01_01918 [Colletotrichum melonis]